MAGETAHFRRCLRGSARQDVTRFAGNSRQVHLAWTRIHTAPSDTPVKISGGRVAGLLGVATATVGTHRFVESRYPMLNLDVAIQAFDFVIGNMGYMQKLRLLKSCQPLLVVMAGVTSLPGHGAFAGYHIAMTEKAVHTEPSHLAMIKGESSGGYDFLGDLVAHRASGRALVGRGILEVAQEAGTARHAYVAALDDLRVAARAAQALGPAQFGQVRLVIEEDAVVNLGAQQ